MCNAGTLGADAFDQIVGRMHHKANGQRYGRHWQMVEAESALALFTEEMHMQVIIYIMMATMTQFIAHSIASILDDMYQMAITEERQCAEYSRLIDSHNLVLQLSERQWPSCCVESLKHKNTISSGLYGVFLQKFF